MNNKITNNNNLSQKVVLITGATGQLGSEICKMFAECDAKVIISDLEIEKCKLLESELKNKYHTEFLSLKLDVTSEESVDLALGKVREKYSKLDILVNNAAIAVFTDFYNRTKDDFMNVFEVNTYGAFNCIQKFISLMKGNEKKSSIINIASIYGCISSDPRIYGENDRRNSEIYSISKAGIIQLTKYLAIELASLHIRVNSISPGGIFNNHDDNFYTNYSNRVPMGRMARVDEILGAIAFLADENMSSYVTGQNLLVDGGMSSW